MDEYGKLNPEAIHSGIYCDLNQFYNEFKINDLIYVNTPIQIKINYLSVSYRKDILSFANDFDIKLKLQTFEEFIRDENLKFLLDKI